MLHIVPVDGARPNPENIHDDGAILECIRHKVFDLNWHNIPCDESDLTYYISPVTYAKAYFSEVIPDKDLADLARTSEAYDTADWCRRFVVNWRAEQSDTPAAMREKLRYSFVGFYPAIGARLGLLDEETNTYTPGGVWNLYIAIFRNNVGSLVCVGDFMEAP